MGRSLLSRLLCMILVLGGISMPLFGQVVSPFSNRPVQSETMGTATVTGETSASVPVTDGTSAAAGIGWVRQDMGEKQGSSILILKDSVNVRSGPGLSFNVLKVAALGTSFPLLGSRSGWYKISLAASPVTTTPATPEAIEAAQNDFLAAYKIYTKAALAGGRNGTAAKKALAGFQAKYAAYKAVAKTSQSLKDIRAGRSAVDKVVISKTDFTSTVYSNGRIVRIFPIAYGGNPDGLNKKVEGDSRTPEGTFKIMNKAKNPVYKGIPGGASNNPLGTRWMGLNTWGGSIGMHGTSAPGSIGSRASHGCVRMYTADAEELFDLVRVGTPVIIQPVKSN